MEAFYVQQALLDQRAAAVVFASTFAQARDGLDAVLQAARAQRRQLSPVLANLAALEQRTAAMAAALAHWMERFSSRTDKVRRAEAGRRLQFGAGGAGMCSQAAVHTPARTLQACQVQPGDQACWQGAVDAVQLAVPVPAPPLLHVSALIVKIYCHELDRQHLTSVQPAGSKDRWA